MLKKTIKYTDYNGRERSEDFYFNLSKAEIAEMELTTPGGLQNMLSRFIKAEDQPSLFKVFKEFILKTYGERDVDGKRFIKNNGELAKAFVETEAYSELFIELISSPNAMSDFVLAVIPADMAAKMPKDPEELSKIALAE